MWITDFFSGAKDASEQRAEPVNIVTPVARPIADTDLLNASATPIFDVTASTAFQVSVVMACTRLIAQGLAQPSLKIVKCDEKGGREDATDHPLYELLAFEPNGFQTSFDFKQQLGLHLGLTNEAFVRKIMVGNSVAALQPIDPSLMTVTYRNNGTVTYKIAGDGRYYTQDEIWHLRGLSWNGYEGMSAITYAAESIGLAKATERYGSKLFTNGARLGGVVSIAGKPTSAQLDAAASAWNAKYSGLDNAHRTAFIGADAATFTPLASSANDAQWTDSRRYQVEEICRAFGIRPSMVMQTGATSYASVEQEFLAHVKFSLAPWHTMFEQSAAKALLTPAERKAGYRIKLNTESLLRGSVAERMAKISTLMDRGVMSVNEARALEDMPRLDDPSFDVPRAAQNIAGKPADEPTTDPTDSGEEANTPEGDDAQ